jgi:hypothetical protein
MGIHESSLVSIRGIQSATIIKKYNFYYYFFFWHISTSIRDKEKSHPNRGYGSQAQKPIQNVQNPISTVYNKESHVMNIPVAQLDHKHLSIGTIDQGWTKFPDSGF